jgi:hypothetical protein
MFSSSFKVSSWTLWSLINLELFDVQSQWGGASISFLHVDTQFSQHHLLKLKTLSFLLQVFGTFLKDQMAIDV